MIMVIAKLIESYLLFFGNHIQWQQEFIIYYELLVTDVNLDY